MDTQHERKHPNDPRCIECAGQIGLFMAGSLKGEAVARMRVLLKGCAGCHRDYTESVQSTASMARGLKETKERRAIDRDKARKRRERVRVISQSVGETGGPSPRSRRFHLQLMIIPALMIWGMMQFERNIADPIVAHIVWEQGDINAGGAPLDEHGSTHNLTGGDFIVLKRGARAQILDGTTVLSLRGPGQWMIEPESGRFRLIHGQASIAAGEPVVIVTADGAATFAAEATGEIQFVKFVPKIECESGSILWQSAVGQTTLERGERWPRRTASR